MLAQNFYVVNKSISDLPYRPFHFENAIELITNIIDSDYFLDIDWSKENNCLVYCEVIMTFGLINENRIIRNNVSRTDNGLGMMVWALPFNGDETFIELFHNLLNKWEQFIAFCIRKEIIMEEYYEQFNNLLGEFKNIPNIELVIQLLDSLMS